MTKQEIGAAIQAKRKDLKVSRLALSKQCEIFRPVIVRIEEGQGNYHVDNLVKVCDALGLSITIS